MKELFLPNKNSNIFELDIQEYNLIKKYDFLITTKQCFELYNLQNYKMLCKRYYTQQIIIYSFYELKIFLDNKIKKNILKDKTISVIYCINKMIPLSRNYNSMYEIRYIDINLKDVINLSCLEPLIRKEKIKSILEEKNMKTFKSFVHTLKHLKNNPFLIEEIKNELENE